MSSGARTERAVARAFAQATDTAAAYDGALAAIAEQHGCTFAAAWEPDATTGDVLRCVSTWTAPGTALEAFERATRELTFRHGEGLPGRVWERDRPTPMSRVAAEAPMPRYEAAEAAGLIWAAGIPLRSERGVVGVVEFFSPAVIVVDRELLATIEVLGAQLGQLVERRRSDERGHVSLQRHRAALQSALDCIVTMDHEGRVVEFNPAAERTFGYRTEDTVGREMAELIVPPHLRDQHRQGLARYLEGGAARMLDQRLEVEAMRIDGSRIPSS